MLSQITIRFITSHSVVIHEETLDIGDLFGVLIKQIVSELVGRKIIKTGEYYHSFIVPRYDENSRFGEESVRIAPLSAVDTSAYTHLSLGWGSPEQLRGEPFLFFTLILQTTPRGLVYRQDLPLDKLDPFLNNLEQQLVKKGKISRRDTKQGIRRELIAQVKESGLEATTTLYILQPTFDDMDLDVDVDIEPETDQDIDIILELIDEELPQRSFEEYDHSQLQKLIVFTDVKILVTSEVWKLVSGLAKLNRGVIKSGLLIGDVYKTHEEKYIVELLELNPIGSLGTDIDQINSDSLHIIQEQKELLSNKRVVGFYRKNQSGPILTLNDMFVQKNFFAHPWQVFLCIGSSIEHTTFYCWYKKEIVVCHESYVFEPI